MEVWLELGSVRVEDLSAVAAACEQAGIDGVTVSDHLVLPEHIGSAYPYTADGSFDWAAELPWPDAWVAIGAMAAATTRLRLATAVLVGPLRRPLPLAKAISTAAVISGGRVICGLGAGWMEEEFAAVGEDFASRGGRLDEITSIMRRLWTGEMVEHRGRHYSFGPVRMLPAPPGPVPLWIGGNSPAAKRRAARNDGWICAYKGPEQAAADLADMRRVLAAAGRGGERFGTAVVGPLRSPTVLRQLRDEGFDAAVVPMALLLHRHSEGGWPAAVEAAAELAQVVRA